MRSMRQSQRDQAIIIRSLDGGGGTRGGGRGDSGEIDRRCLGKAGTGAGVDGEQGGVKRSPWWGLTIVGVTGQRQGND
jgi:hypothetical protein